MAFEIVDGMTGTKHISSDDLAALNTATVGKADCVLEYGDDFKLTMASANSATLGTGVGMVGGKRFWNQAATSLTIQSGTQGQKRNDLVVARYQKTSAGIESITPVVIKGTPTTGAAADPTTTANDLKLWRVPLDGINAGTPVRLFEPVTPLATLGESVSPTVLFDGKPSESESVTLSQSVAGFARITIMYQDTDETFGSVDVPIEDGASSIYATLSTTVVGPLGWFIKSRTVEIQGATIKTRKFGSDNMAGEVAKGSSSISDMIAIRKVLGHKQ